MYFRDITIVVIGFLVGLIGGYVLGREHLKYEMRNAIVSATNGLAGVSRPSVKGAASPSLKKKQHSNLTATLSKKGFHPSDPSSHDYQEAVTFSVTFWNGTGKDIRAFDGVLAFTDLLDNEILSAKVAINEPVEIGSLLNWDGQLDYNQFNSSHRRLRDEGQENLKVQFTVRKILFADRTTQTFDE